MSERKFTYKKNEAQASLKANEQQLEKLLSKYPDEKIQIAQTKKLISLWKYILKRMGSKNEITLPASTIQKKTYL